jgi:hypothetical protein
VSDAVRRYLNERKHTACDVLPTRGKPSNGRVN